MNLLCLDHVHFSVPDLSRARQIFGPFLGGTFTADYGGPEQNAFGTWNTAGGDFIQALRPGEPVFGGAAISRLGILSVSFRVPDIDAGIDEAKAAGLQLRSRIGSEDIGLGRNVVQAQFAPDDVSGLPLELIEHQLPGNHIPLNQAAVDYVEHYVDELEAPVAFLSRIFGSDFEPAVIDDSLGTRSRRHARLGIQLTAPSRSRSVAATRLAELGPGLHAIAFQCADLERGIATASSLGLELVRRRRSGPGAQEAEFAPWSGVIAKLVQRKA